MGVTEGQAIEIPPQYDPGKSTIVLMETFESSVKEMRDHAQTDHIRDHNHTVGQMELEGSALTNGRRALAQKNPAESGTVKKTREKQDAAHRTLLKQFLDRLEDLYRQIEAINQRLDEIVTEISELERLQKLAEDGMLDPNNPDHAKILKKYGITKEDIERGNLSLILADKLGQREDERTELQQRKESLQHQAQEAIAEVQAGETITPEEAEQFEQRLESLEAGVSAVVWDLNESSEELKNMATDRFNNILDEEGSAGSLQLQASSKETLSFAASLDKTLQEGEPDKSLTEKFSSMPGPSQDTVAPEQPARQTLVPGTPKA